MELRVVSGAYRGKLCESPVWDNDAECLWFVDVLTGVGRCRPSSGDVKIWATPNWVGCVAMRLEGGLVAALADATDHSGGKLCALTLREDASDADYELTLATLPLEPSSCPNDGAVDAAGRLWVGSKTLLPHGRYCKDSAGLPSPDPEGPTPAGRLFVVAGADVRRCGEVGAVTVSNGIGWSPDSCKMYYVDSPSKCVFVFDYSVASGHVANKRLFASTSSMAGVPDGLAVDVEGGVWVALWDGAAVVHFSSAGMLLRRITLPVSRPTSVAFGRGHELYITTCSFDAGDQEPAVHEPLAGAIFVIDDAGVAGAPVARCRF